MGLRPAHAYRDIKGQAWTRFSRHKPRRSYVKSRPGSVLRKFDHGDPNAKYELQIDLMTEDGVQVRDNAIESARQAVHKYLETNCPGRYFLRVRVYPHVVLRENKMITGAGADRLQTGMQRAFGRPMRIAARIYANKPIYTVKIMKADLTAAKEAFRRAKCKLCGHYYLKVTELAAAA